MTALWWCQSIYKLSNGLQMDMRTPKASIIFLDVSEKIPSLNSCEINFSNLVHLNNSPPPPHLDGQAPQFESHQVGHRPLTFILKGKNNLSRNFPQKEISNSNMQKLLSPSLTTYQFININIHFRARHFFFFFNAFISYFLNVTHFIFCWIFLNNHAYYKNHDHAAEDCVQLYCMYNLHAFCIRKTNSSQ